MHILCTSLLTSCYNSIVMNDFPWLEVAISVVALGSGLAGYFKIIVPFASRIKKWITTWEGFMEDWSGEEARPGRDAVPGVMQRLNDIDGELKRNGGGSMKDSLDRMEKDVHEMTGNIKTLTSDSKQIRERLEDGDRRFEKIEKRLDKLEDL